MKISLPPRSVSRSPKSLAAKSSIQKSSGISNIPARNRPAHMRGNPRVPFAMTVTGSQWSWMW